MKLVQHTRRLLTALTLGLIFTFTMALGTAFYQHDWAAASSELVGTTSYNQQITLADASFAERAKATGKDIQGKAQEARGNIAGDPKDQAAGKARQFEGQTRNTAEDVKDSSASLQERIGSAAKNVQGKAQEAFGNATGDTGDQAAGKTKQAESNVRNLVEDAKGRS